MTFYLCRRTFADEPMQCMCSLENICKTVNICELLQTPVNICDIQYRCCRYFAGANVMCSFDCWESTPNRKVPRTHDLNTSMLIFPCVTFYTFSCVTFFTFSKHSWFCISICDIFQGGQFLAGPHLFRQVTFLKHLCFYFCATKTFIRGNVHLSKCMKSLCKLQGEHFNF